MLLFNLLSLLNSTETLYTIHKITETDDKVPIKKLKNENGIFTFYESNITSPTKRIQNHVSFLLQKLVAIKHIPIVYEMKKMKYTILPFKKVTLLDGADEISLGTYARSYIKDGLFYQVFDCGNNCDLRKSIKRKTTVCYKSLAGELRVDLFIEKKLCNYEMTIGGDHLTRCIENIKNIEYSVEKAI